VLRVEGLNVHYGGIHALKNVTLHVPEEKVVTLVGANGAGKSTLLRTVCGLVPATSGTIRYLGRPITGIAPHRIAREGIAMAPEGRRVFVNLSVYENLLGPTGAQKKKSSATSSDLRTFPRLLDGASSRGNPFRGEQQMLAFAAPHVEAEAAPSDEPSRGLRFSSARYSGSSARFT
jgi:branched-chain amino acid transport system ATP-binding protein